MNIQISREQLERWQKTALQWGIDSIGVEIMHMLATPVVERAEQPAPVAVELSALREELAKAKEELEREEIRTIEFSERLTAAEQRNSDLERDAARYRWLRNPEQRDCVPPELDVICGVAEDEDVLWFEQLDRTIDAALKPTESGASKKAPKCCQCGACPAESKP